MLEIEQVARGMELGYLRNLRRYTRSEVEAVNAGARLFADLPSWRTCVEETFRELLEVPQGMRLSIAQSSQVHDEEMHTYEFEQKAITIGRATENDISLPLRSISRQHARIIQRDGGFFIEDLESASGTYVNRQKLEPGHPRQLRSGDEFLIFPYAFKVTPEELWARDAEIMVTSSSKFSPSAASAFVTSLGSDLCLFQVTLHPEMGQVTLALARPFLASMVSRMTRDAVSELAEGDALLLEFIVVSILERANREFQFPFQCSLVPRDRFALADEPGLMLEAGVKLTDLQGRLTLFLPESCLEKLRGAITAPSSSDAFAQLSWKVALRLGSVDLSRRDLDDLECGDTLLYADRAELLLPGQPSERGWIVDRNADAAGHFEVKSFFERGLYMRQDPNAPEQKNSAELGLASLPVRVDVVLSQLEMSLQELEGLREGSIVELEETPGQVQLVVNGVVVGAGELVGIDDRLGVQISRWRAV